ncbi:MAG: hemerythrin domain-containing protein [Deltaproteobacteria bacterium]
MKNPVPVKRHEALKNLSREHHQALLLCWHIKEGLKKTVDPLRIRSYAGFIWETNLKQHFEIEEKYLFPILGRNHELIKRAIDEHLKLESLFISEGEILKILEHIKEELEAHIRFEERVLFNLLQEKATEDQLRVLAVNSTGSACIIWEDEFWK